TDSGRGNPQSGLAHSWRTGQSRRQRQILFIDYQPTGQELLQNLILPDPLAMYGMALAKFNIHTIDLYLSLHNECSLRQLTAAGSRLRPLTLGRQPGLDNPAQRMRGFF